MTPRVKETLNKIIERFESSDIPEAVAYSMFPIPDLPCSKWSLLNRTLVFLSGSMDVRGIRQWIRVNRYVKKGSKAIYILVPYVKHIEDDLGENKHKLLGFGVSPVFRVEDTQGELLEYENIEVPKFPLMDRAHDWAFLSNPYQATIVISATIRQAGRKLHWPQARSVSFSTNWPTQDTTSSKVISDPGPASRDCSRAVGVCFGTDGGKIHRR